MMTMGAVQASSLNVSSDQNVTLLADSAKRFKRKPGRQRSNSLAACFRALGDEATDGTIYLCPHLFPRKGTFLPLVITDP